MCPETSKKIFTKLQKFLIQSKTKHVKFNNIEGKKNMSNLKQIIKSIEVLVISLIWKVLFKLLDDGNTRGYNRKHSKKDVIQHEKQTFFY